MENTEKKGRPILVRAIECLSRREHSREELESKLKGKLREDESAEDIRAALDTLEEKGYLSNERYAQARVRMRAARYGNRRLEYELQQSGVSSELIEQALEQAGDETERARQVWERKFGEPPADYRERNRQIRFLASRGFPFDVIERVIRGSDEG